MQAGPFDRRSTRLRRVAIAGMVVSALVGAACSASDSSSPDTPPVSGIAATETTEPGGRPICNRPVAPPVAVSSVPGIPSDHDVTSFDGTEIRAHWFPNPESTQGKASPTIFMGPGWGSPGDTNLSAVGMFGALNIRALQGAGFNVLTWDPRGFGQSTGTATVNSKDHEGRDTQTLIDWVATQPGVQTDAAGDPRMGMIGGSYGGGIQLTTAGIDCRVDALVPVIAWHSLETSLFKAETPKSGWANLLSTVTSLRPVDPTTTRANTSANERGVVDPADIRWFKERGPGDVVGNIKVPTLLVQGTVDTLFTLDEAITNYNILKGNGVPVSMLWYCGGHGVCLTAGGDADRMEKAATAWLRRYVKGEESVDTGPRFDFIDQNGVRYTGDDYPLPAGAPVTAEGNGTLKLREDGGAGPVTPPADYQRDVISLVVLPITPGKASNAVNIPISFNSPTMVVGAPTVELTYKGTSPAGERPTRVFAQLVDEATGLAVGNQITPIQVTLDGQSHTVKVPLEAVSYAATAGTRLTLQLVATTTAYAKPRFGGTVTFDKASVTLPVAAGITPVPR